MSGLRGSEKLGGEARGSWTLEYIIEQVQERASNLTLVVRSQTGLHRPAKLYTLAEPIESPAIHGSRPHSGLELNRVLSSQPHFILFIHLVDLNSRGNDVLVPAIK